ncbi:unnamed protein product [Schistosoma margrebowiei]|uniref:Trimethylguanosine synthase n=1 Tax=Schistosoma margrebowiei TaxID=48269 RepID=A0A183MLF3_9TREM|nr:unnamed protein product [Schistosoma margrebowiei]
MLSCTSKILYRDRFKGFRTCSELSKKDQDFSNANSSNHVSKFPQKKKLNRQSEHNIIETVPTIVSKHIVFSDSEENNKQPFAIASEKEKHLIDNTDVNCSSIKKPLQSRKYFTSVSYTLKHLLHSDSVISESDSSSDSNHELRTQNFVLPTASSQATKRTIPNVLSFNSSKSNTSVVSSDVDELCKMLDEMQQLGFPTSFGCPHKQKSVNLKSAKSEDILFDYYDDGEVDQWLLVFASRCKDNTAQRKQRSIVRHCLSDLDLESVRYSGSLFMSSFGELKSLVDPYICAGSVFSRMCYVLEMDILEEDETTMGDSREGIKEALTSMCQGVLGHKKHHHKEWISMQTLVKTQDRKKQEDSNEQQTNKNIESRGTSNTQKQMKKSIGDDKQKYVEKLAPTEEKAVREGNEKQQYDTTKKLTGNCTLLYNCRFFWRYNPPVPKLACESKQLMCNSFDPSMDKYWAQRFRLFSRFDSGIQVDCDSLFSATPEVIAAHQAKRIYRVFTPSTKGSYTVLDIFCGTGSNAIQFALRGFRVIAIESDPIRISMAANNAEIYGVRHLIEFVCEDYFTWAWKQIQSNFVSQSGLTNNVEYTAALMSPPWGGPSYLEHESFNLSSIKFQNSNTNLWCALYLALVLTNGNVALFLPRNTNMADFLEISAKCIREIKMDSLDIEFELNLINFKSKALTVYFGTLANANRRTADTKSDHSDESDYLS